MGFAQWGAPETTAVAELTKLVGLAPTMLTAPVCGTTAQIAQWGDLSLIFPSGPLTLIGDTFNAGGWANSRYTANGAPPAPAAGVTLWPDVTAWSGVRVGTTVAKALLLDSNATEFAHTDRGTPALVADGLVDYDVASLDGFVAAVHPLDRISEISVTNGNC